MTGGPVTVNDKTIGRVVEVSSLRVTRFEARCVECGRLDGFHRNVRGAVGQLHTHFSDEHASDWTALQEALR